MINNRQITEFITSEVSTNLDIETYCVDNFSKSILILVGVDVENAPEEESMPILLVEPVIKSIGESNSNFEYEMFLRLLIVGNDKPSTNGNIVTYDGIYQIEELGNMIVELLKESFAQKSNMDVFEVEFYHDEINTFPIYTGSIMINFSVPNTIGCSKIAFN